MKRYARIRRTAMVGGGLSYDVYIPTKFLPDNAESHHYTTTILSEEGKKTNFTRGYVSVYWWKSAEYFAEPQGWNKYDIGKRDEKTAIEFFRPYLEAAFPETKQIPTSRDPFSLWHTGLVANETSEEKIVKF